MRRISLVLIPFLVLGASCSKGQQSATEPNKPPPPPPAKPKEFHDAKTLYAAVSRQYAPATQPAREGSIDWATGKITATGVGKASGTGPQAKLLARRAAQALAQRNAVLIANGVRVDAAGRIKDIKEGKINVEGMVQGFQTRFGEFDEENKTITATIEVPFYGVSGMVRIDGAALDAPAARWEWLVKDAVDREADLLIVDARGTGFQPCLAPRLVTETGQVVFDGTSVPGGLQGRHLAVYVSADRPPGGQGAPATATAESASDSGPAGGRAFVAKDVVELRAKASTGPDHCALVLGSEELAKLSRHADAMELLKAGRLVVIVDPVPPSSE